MDQSFSVFLNNNFRWCGDFLGWRFGLMVDPKQLVDLWYRPVHLGYFVASVDVHGCIALDE